MRFSLLLLIVALVSCRSEDGLQHSLAKPDRTLSVAFYNLENLFDPADDPRIEGDDEFTPAGRLQWTPQRLERKLESVARAIRAMDEYTGVDVIGLSEVENRAVLDRLVGEFLPKDQYAVVHEESPDERGIDVALLYRPAVLKHVGTRMHRVDMGAGERPTRDVMEVTFERDRRRLTVLVNHWPSRSGGAEASEPKRVEAARTAARVIDSLMALDPTADIVLVGDLNDEPRDRSVREVLDGAEYAEGFTHRMINLAAPVARVDTIGSYNYRGDWQTIDQILVSRGALDRRGLTLYETSQSIFAPAFLRDEKSRDAVLPPWRMYRGTQYIGGTSDHFPVVVRFGWGGDHADGD